LAGEKAVEQFCNKHLIFRVSWLFSEFGHNFVKTMLALGSTREQLRVVSGQIGKPTCAAEVVRVILEILPTLYNEFDSESDKNLDSKWGIYHLAQPDVISWHGFAQAIFSQIVFDREKLSVKEILPIPTSGYPTPAQRPANSELDCRKLQETFGIALIDWQQSLAQTLSALEITESKNETAQSDE
jgi:dTDP-4-dehydrorhamnose reductase